MWSCACYESGYAQFLPQRSQTNRENSARDRSTRVLQLLFQAHCPSFMGRRRKILRCCWMSFHRLRFLFDFFAIKRRKRLLP